MIYRTAQQAPEKYINRSSDFTAQAISADTSMSNFISVNGHDHKEQSADAIKAALEMLRNSTTRKWNRCAEWLWAIMCIPGRQEFWELWPPFKTNYIGQVEVPGIFKPRLLL